MSMPAIRPRDVTFQLEMPVSGKTTDKTQLLHLKIDPSIDLEALTQKIAEKILSAPGSSENPVLGDASNLAKRLVVTHSSKPEPDVIHTAKLGEAKYPSLSSILEDQMHRGAGTSASPISVKIKPS
jgi:hypothetical protein